MKKRQERACSQCYVATTGLAVLYSRFSSISQSISTEFSWLQFGLAPAMRNLRTCTSFARKEAANVRRLLLTVLLGQRFLIELISTDASGLRVRSIMPPYQVVLSAIAL
jgi:hypothetical protein